ncbi:heterokaryon incompatibility protein [Phlyctema vagabunda]|uniref:Heterokaryon incompatibility protein n=1 Tax=Phlyctema vagabunda TaxID=108571 RepID=A0ABR4P2Z3_9HELO
MSSDTNNGYSLKHIGRFTEVFLKTRTNGYRYKSLQHDDEIRILLLEPGTVSEPVSCELHHVRLSEDVVYEALSYAWGSTSKPRTILCENKNLAVTESLFAALKHIRFPDKRRIIWADAICINQDLDAEKNHQVGLMAKIYSHAQQTLVWVGEDINNVAERALDYITRLDTYLSNNIPKYRNATKPVDISFVNQNDLSQHTRLSLSQEWLPDLCKNTGPLLTLPWFRRLWIVQEVALATLVELRFGNVSLPFEKLMRVLVVMVVRIGLNDVPVGFDTRGFYNLPKIGAIRISIQNAESRLQELPQNCFAMVGSFTTTDPRDKIYGLLGLGFLPGLAADYTLSIVEVFQSFARWCLSNQPHLELLSIAHGVTESKWNIPSWMPSPEMDLATRMYAPHFCASGSNVRPIDHSTVWSPDRPNIISLCAKVIEGLAEISELEMFVDGFPSREGMMEISRIAACTVNVPTDERYNRLCHAMGCGTVAFSSVVIAESFDYCFQTAQKDLDENEEVEIEDERSHTMFYIFERTLQFCRFCVTTQDKFAWVPKSAKINDKICIIQSPTTPYVLRPLESGQFLLVGQCYVQGIMHGEALDMPGFEWENINLA